MSAVSVACCTEGCQADVDDSDIEEVTKVIRFDPPVGIQRYKVVCDILSKENITSVVDFGVSNCKSITHYKSVLSLERIIGVDIDRALLESSQFSVMPLITDYVSPSRTSPLHITVMCGSVAELDTRLCGVDAVVMIELIEHLHDDTLRSFPEVVFGRLHPRLVIVTTPNADFNVFFSDFSGKRHWDHKFEWSRQQFSEWCAGVCRCYDYTVEYGGVGDAPEGRTDLGKCSQYAVFKSRSGSHGEALPSDADTPYSVVVDCHHPHQKDTSTADQLSDEVSYYLRQMALSAAGDDDLRQVNLSVEGLMDFTRVKNLCPDLDQLRQVLTESGYELTPDGSEVIYPLVEESDCDITSDDSNISHHSFFTEEEIRDEPEHQDVSHEENWDDVPEEDDPQFEDSAQDCTRLTKQPDPSNRPSTRPHNMHYLPMFDNIHPVMYKDSAFRARIRNELYLIHSQFSDAESLDDTSAD